jgi:hypothetical protein
MSMRAVIIFLCLALTPIAALGATQPRPFSGYGLLIIRPFNTDAPANPATLTFYREPGVERIAVCAVGDIPLLTSILTPAVAEYSLAVMGKRGNWMLIAYDDAGREGWVEMARWWEYCPWEAFLKGRVARLLPGLKKERYTLQAGPSETSPQSGTLSDLEVLRLIEVRDDWALVITDSGRHGWLSWRDGDGRFQIAVGEKINPQKR